MSTDETTKTAIQSTISCIDVINYQNNYDALIDNLHKQTLQAINTTVVFLGIVAATVIAGAVASELTVGTGVTSVGTSASMPVASGSATTVGTAIQAAPAANAAGQVSLKLIAGGKSISATVIKSGAAAAGSAAAASITLSASYQYQNSNLGKDGITHLSPVKYDGISPAPGTFGIIRTDKGYYVAEA